MATSEELLKQMYDSNLASQKAGLKSDYDAALADLNAQKAANQQQADNNVRLTKTEADRSAVNAAEYYAAAGLSSGAKAQARLAAENQLLSDLTAIRATQQQADADVERQRGLLSQQYAAAIREAQANNDMARAQALYEAAKLAESRLFEQQQSEAQRLWQAEQDKLAREQGVLDTAEQRAYDAKLSFAKYMMEEMNDPSYMEALGVYTAPKTDQQYRDETLTSLKQAFPSGIVSDRNLWQSIVDAYGEDFLTSNGFRVYTYANANGGGRTPDFAVANK